MHDGGLEAARGAPATADATLATDTSTFAALLWHGLAPAAARGSGRLETTGDRRLIERLLRLFPLPSGKYAPVHAERRGTS